MMPPGMVSQAFLDVETRHRLLEGFLLRLAQDRDADAFVLRGGMLVRHWFPTVGRTARDVDLVCRLPFDIDDLRGRLGAILATVVDDGVAFEPRRFRLDCIRPDDAHPGLRLFAAGRADGWFGEMSVDLTFQLDVWPTATRRPLACERGAAEIWVCQPEMLIGRKLAVTSQLGRRHWRPKDLCDLWLMFQRFPQVPVVLGDAIERSFSRESALHRLDDVFAQPSWWSERTASARWQRFIRPVPRLSVPRDLETVVDEVRCRLAPITRAHPKELK